MDNNFESLLKTNTETKVVAQQSDDALKYSKQKIRRICKNLCLPSNNYDPSKTVFAINNYLHEKATRERILYSEISSFVYGLSEDQQGNFGTNIESLLTYVLDNSNNVAEDPSKIVIKIYDHFQLSISQKNLSTEKNEIASASLVDKVEKANTLIEETSQNVKNLEKEYITILGIFASIVLAFVGGLTFSTSVLQHINAISIYRLLLIVDLIAVVLLNVVFVLIKFICHINNKKLRMISVLWFNIIFGIIGVLVVIAWMIDFHSLVDFIRSYLPWL